MIWNIEKYLKNIQHFFAVYIQDFLGYSDALKVLDILKGKNVGYS